MEYESKRKINPMKKACSYNDMLEDNDIKIIFEIKIEEYDTIRFFFSLNYFSIKFSII